MEDEQRIEFTLEDIEYLKHFLSRYVKGFSIYDSAAVCLFLATKMGILPLNDGNNVS